MTKNDFIRELEAMMTLPPNALSESTPLSKVPQWDSMETLNYVVLVKEKFDKIVDGADVAKARTVTDLVTLVGDALEG